MLQMPEFFGYRVSKDFPHKYRASFKNFKIGLFFILETISFQILKAKDENLLLQK